MKTIKTTQSSTVIIEQLLRSASSVGANFEEASESFTRKEFAYKAAVAKKETKESNYWLRLLVDCEFVEQKDVSDCNYLIDESKELVLILNSMLKKY